VGGAERHRTGPVVRTKTTIRPNAETLREKNGCYEAFRASFPQLVGVDADAALCVGANDFGVR